MLGFVYFLGLKIKFENRQKMNVIGNQKVIGGRREECQGFLFSWRDLGSFIGQAEFELGFEGGKEKEVAGVFGGRGFFVEGRVSFMF